MTLSIDIGGTFTDFVLIDKGNIKHFKCPSNPINPENAIKEGLKDKDFEGECYHGTTVATNAFLEGKGVKTAFITNKGFEDILFIARQDRPELYNLHVKKPEPPIKREHCYGIQGRINSKGEVIEDLDLGQIKDVARVLKINGLSASICLLHSYINPKHELEVGKILDGFDVNYSLSSQVSREFREYERGLTTVLDAYLSPLLKNYFDSIEKIIGKEPWIMKSSGGLEKASDIDPVDTLFSGPAGGVAGGQHVSKLANISNLVTFDMGGTSADMATIIGGQISWKDEGMIDRFPIQSKMVDIVTVGSGGGSIARCDEGGALRVGPQSAGAYPGPICYGRDGEKPTVTDTLLCMGYID
ncbi:MAG: hydantoinase/oxoprolinase family protein, partial [Thermoplasmatota archaeon]